MGQEWQQTGTGGTYTGTKCDATSIATNPCEKQIDLTGSGGSEVTVTIPTKASYTAATFCPDEAVGVTSIPAGTWNVKVNVTSAAASGSTISAVYVCRVNSSGTSQATIASSTGLSVDVGVTGVKSIDVTQASAHGCSATDYFYVQVVVDGNAHAGTTIGITPDQLITDTAASTQQGSATLASTGALTAVGSSFSINTGTATLASTGAVTAIGAASGVTTEYGVGSCAATGSLTATAHAKKFAQATIGGGASINMWPNADLEAGISDWSVYTSGSISHSSTEAWEQTYSLKSATAMWSGAVADDFTDFELSTQYTWSFYFYVEDSGLDLRFAIEDQDTNNIASDTYPSVTPDQWTRYDLAGWTGSDDTAVVVKIFQFSTDISTNFYVDGFMMEPGGTASTWVNYGLPQSDLTAKGYVKKAGTATLAATGALTAIGDVTLHRGKSTIAGVGDLSVPTTTLKKFGLSTIAGTGTLTAVGSTEGGTQYGAATLASAGSLTSIAYAKKWGLVTSSATGLVSASANAKRWAAATLASSGALTGVANAKRWGVATLSSTGSVTAIGSTSGIKYGAATIAATGALNAVANAKHFASAAMASTGSLTAIGSVGVKFGQATLAATGSLTSIGALPGRQFALLPRSDWPDGVITGKQGAYGSGWEVGAYIYYPMGKATIAGTGALSAVGSTSGNKYGQATLAASGSVTATASAKRWGASTIAGVGALTASANAVKSGQATVAATGAVTVSGFAIKSRTATISATGSLSAAGNAKKAGAATIAAAGTLTAIGGVVLHRGSATLSSSGLLTVSASIPVTVTPSLGTIVITGFNPTVTVGTTVRPGLGTVVIQGFNPTVTATTATGIFISGITRIAMKMATILRR